MCWRTSPPVAAPRRLCAGRGHQARRERAQHADPHAHGRCRVARERRLRSSSAAWSAEASGDVAQAARSAVFCADTDGYEYLSPFALEELSATVEGTARVEPREYPARRAVLSRGSSGYAALADGAKALECRGRLTFDGADASPDRAAHRRGTPPAQKTALLFRITAQDAALLHLRFCSRRAHTARGMIKAFIHGHWRDKRQ